MSQSDLFQTLKSTTDIWAKKVELPHPKVEGMSYGGGSNLELDVRCSLTFASASYHEAQRPDAYYSAFLLSFNVGFTPKHDKNVGMYAIVVRPLQDGSTPLSEIAGESTPVLGADDPMKYQWDPTPSDKAGLSGAIWRSTSPETLDNTTSYANTISFSLGANANFFGKEKTGGASIDYSMSHEETVNVAAVRIRNLSNSDMMYYEFQPQSDLAARSSFQPAFSGILLIPDDKTGGRGSVLGKGFRELTLEVKFIVAPLDQRVTTQHASGGLHGVSFGEDTYSRAYHEFTHVLKLNFPPVE